MILGVVEVCLAEIIPVATLEIYWGDLVYFLEGWGFKVVGVILVMAHYTKAHVCWGEYQPFSTSSKKLKDKSYYI